MGELEKLRDELERRGKGQALEELARSADGQALGRHAEQLRQAAERGDSAALREMLGRVLRTEEGRRMAEQIKAMMGGE